MKFIQAVLLLSLLGGLSVAKAGDSGGKVNCPSQAKNSNVTGWTAEERDTKTVLAQTNFSDVDPAAKPSDVSPNSSSTIQH